MAGFDSIIVLLGLLVIPALYLIYNQMIKKRRKAAIKFSNLMFVKSAISNKKKSKRDMWIFIHNCTYDNWICRPSHTFGAK